MLYFSSRKGKGGNLHERFAPKLQGDVVVAQKKKKIEIPVSFGYFWRAPFTERVFYAVIVTSKTLVRSTRL